MNPREQYIALFEDLAKRHVDINHQPAVANGGRFFVEPDYNVIQGGAKLYNAGWNLILEGFDGKVDDNRHGGTPILEKVGFSVLKHCKREDSAAQAAAYKDGWAIGWELLNHLRAVCANRHNAVANNWISAGVNIPQHIVTGSIQFLDVGPRFDQYYGQRFSVDMRVVCSLSYERTSNRWQTPS